MVTETLICKIQNVCQTCIPLDKQCHLSYFWLWQRAKWQIMNSKKRLRFLRWWFRWAVARFKMRTVFCSLHKTNGGQNHRNQSITLLIEREQHPSLVFKYTACTYSLVTEECLCVEQKCSCSLECHKLNLYYCCLTFFFTFRVSVNLPDIIVLATGI